MPGYYVHDLSPYLVQMSENWGVRWYGLAYVAAFIIGIFLVRELSRKGYCDIPPEQVSDFIIGVAMFGVLLGGRLGYMLFYDLDHFLQNPLIIVRVWDGGMSAHGGFLGVMAYTLWYSRKNRISWLNIGDNLVVAVPIGLFLGRLANFVNGELYGRVTSVRWAVQFPNELLTAPVETVQLAIAEASAINPEWVSPGAIIANVGRSESLRASLGGILSPRHPSQIYEAILEGALLFAVMLFLRTRVRLPNGMLTGVFFILYGALRSFCELFREPDAPLAGALTRGQFLSIFLALIGIAFIAAARLRPAYPVARRP